MMNATTAASRAAVEILVKYPIQNLTADSCSAGGDDPTDFECCSSALSVATLKNGLLGATFGGSTT
jgi:hypothetical protein